MRGYDLSVMSVIAGDTGWIVVDPLISSETARASMRLVDEQLGERPVVAVIYSHSHVDHFGGVEGVTTVADLSVARWPIEVETALRDWHLGRPPTPAELTFRLRRGRQSDRQRDTITSLRRTLADAQAG